MRKVSEILTLIVLYFCLMYLYYNGFKNEMYFGSIFLSASTTLVFYLAIKEYLKG